MLKFQTDDKDLTIWINGNTKKPEDLNQDELAAIRKNGDPRVVDASSTKAKQAPQIEA